MTTLEQLQHENDQMKSDIRLIAKVVKKSLQELGFMDNSGTIKIDGRSIGKVLPMALNGKLGEQLSGLSEIVPLFDKYKHLID